MGSGNCKASKLKTHGNQRLDSLWGGSQWALKAEITPSHYPQHKIKSYTQYHVYISEQNKLSPACFQSNRARDFLSSRRRRVAREDMKALLSQDLSLDPASLIPAHASLTNAGQAFNSVQCTWGATKSQQVCALDSPGNSFFHHLDSIKDTRVCEKQVWPRWSSAGRKHTPEHLTLPGLLAPAHHHLLTQAFTAVGPQVVNGC